MGIQRMPPDPQTGQLERLSSDEAHVDNGKQDILMYPENTLLNSQATLITPSGTFYPGATFKVYLDNGRTFNIRAIKAKESNPMIEQFTFEYLQD